MADKCSGHTGDGGPALSATFSALGGMLADNQGGVYAIDGVYIRHVLADGTVQAVAGNGKFGFSGDGGKAVDAAISAWNTAVAWLWMGFKQSVFHRFR